jgi:hypothetical protein
MHAYINWDSMTVTLLILSTAVMGCTGYGVASVKQRFDPSQKTTSCLPPLDNDALSLTAEPRFLDKMARRMNVYFLAGRVFLDYKLTQRKEKKMKQKLGISEDEEDDSITAMWDEVNTRNAELLTSKIKSLQGFWIKVSTYRDEDLH